jgi:hypothetical protein
MKGTQLALIGAPWVLLTGSAYAATTVANCCPLCPFCHKDRRHTAAGGHSCPTAHLQRNARPPRRGAGRRSNSLLRRATRKLVPKKTETSVRRLPRRKLIGLRRASHERKPAKESAPLRFWKPIGSWIS